MTIPQHKNKFDSDITLKPEDLFFKSNKVSNIKELPVAPYNCIFSPITKINDHLDNKLSLSNGPNIIKPIRLSADHKIAVFCDFVGFGSPMWAWVFEQLIIYGIKRFIFIGVFGSVNEKYNPNEVYVVDKALKDEGVSHHYSKSDEQWSYPDESLTKQLQTEGAKPIAVWTTDAMFRQTHSEIEHANANNIAGFEMECSALFTIAKEKNIQIASLQVISDHYINGKYTSIYNSDACKDNLNKAVDMAIKILDE